MSEVVAGGRPPSAVRTAVALMYVVAGLALVQGALSLVAAPLNSTHLAAALLSLAFAVAYVVLARNVPRGSRLARSVGVALSGLSMLGDVFQLGTNSAAGTVGIVLNGAIIFLLAVHRDSRRFFGRQAGPERP